MRVDIIREEADIADQAPYAEKGDEVLLCSEGLNKIGQLRIAEAQEVNQQEYQQGQ